MGILSYQLEMHMNSTSEKNNAGLVKGDRQNVSIYEAG